jgi:CubicO group peptidase (beta-lactamase class C family)
MHVSQPFRFSGVAFLGCMQQKVFLRIFSADHLKTAMKRSLLLFACLTVYSIAMKAQSTGHATPSEKALDSLFTAYSGNNPGISVLVIKMGKPVYQKSFGMADIVNNVKVTPATNFRLASFTKQFTAMSIMILEEQGKLSLNDPLSKYFPSFPSWAQAVRLQHLLTHTSGIVDYEALIPDTTTIPVSDADVVRLLEHCDSVYRKPGEKYAYSNSAYVLLGVIIQKVSGQSFEEFVRSQIFKPLAMSASAFNGLKAVIANRAYGYVVRKDSIQPRDQSITSYTLGDGGIYSSINDLFKWDQALYTTKLVKAATLERIYTVQSQLPAGTDEYAHEAGYGYGWFIRTINNEKWVSHSGGTSGFSTWITRNPAQQFSIVILTNRSGQNLDVLSDKIKAIYGY